MKALLLTLGHNSSAVLVDNNEVVIGFEQERLDKKKSSSAFPKDAIEKIIEIEQLKELDYIFVSHWFDNFDFRLSKNEAYKKYWNEEYVQGLKEKLSCKSIIPLSVLFTHHDAHAYSAKAFYENHKKQNHPNNCHYIVCDGFGNNQEVFSIYKENEKGLGLVSRVYGYENSLGLFYQYATSFVGMKENQDEYKFLGYEAHINEIGLLNKDMLNLSADDFALSMFKRSVFEGKSNDGTSNDYIDTDKLGYVKEHVHSRLSYLVKMMKFSTDAKSVEELEFRQRVVVGYFIQRVVETYFEKVIAKFNIENLVVAGGVFYNVKLNNFINNKIKGFFSVMPIAGDQGCGIGMYRKYVGEISLGDFCWGKRICDKKSIEKELQESSIAGSIKFFSKLKELQDFCYEKIVNEDAIVQVIGKSMEFGPRALMQTSSIFRPTKENAATINLLNDRNEVMPLAPVVLDENLDLLFSENETKKVVGSDNFMIITYKYEELYNKNFAKYGGVMHKFPDVEHYSGRPQVVKRGHYLYKLLRDLSDMGHLALVNTSYNFHGSPIVYTYKDAVVDFMKQMSQREKLGITKKVYLVFYS